MILARQDKKTWIFLALLLLTLTANLALYLLPFELLPAPSEAIGIVIGSLFDFVIVMPLLILAITRKKGFSLKRLITFMVIGIFAARFIIPASYFEPFKFIPFVAIAMEGMIILGEIGLILILLKHLPGIINDVKKSGEGPLFVFSETVERRVSSHPIIRVISAEAVMFYYAFASWKKKRVEGENRFTLHTKTSLISLQVMLIHAIVFETFAIHWWLYDVSIILSIVLLILNIYTVIFFVGDIQAIRLNPVVVEEKQIRISLGLGKRMTIPFDEIKHISWGKEAADVNLKEKGMLEFIALNMEEGTPHCVITFNSSLKATLFMGFQKKCSKVAIRVDDPARFRNCVEEKVEA